MTELIDESKVLLNILEAFDEKEALKILHNYGFQKWREGAEEARYEAAENS